jgi:hypothetical protein
MRVDDIAARYPLLYHMAECDSWPGITRHGLLSTTAALDLFEVNDQRRNTLERIRRPEKELLDHPVHGRLVLRDQKPLNEKRLASCLQGGLTPADWYALLNGKTFFWARRDRLLTLLQAEAYRDDEHDVLTVDAASLLAAHHQRVSLCHMNSGNTGRFAWPRGSNTFLPIAAYPARKSGRPIKEVVELVVDYAVHDIVDHVVRVEKMRSDVVLGTIWER